MSAPFDKTTEQKAEEYIVDRIPYFAHRDGFYTGRNSTRASMEMLASAVRIAKLFFEYDAKLSGGAVDTELAKAIAAVKANGDWPLPLDEE